MPDRPSAQARTLRTYQERAAAYVATTPTKRLPGQVDLMARLTDLVPAGHVLEIGSGPGTDADELESRGLSVDRTDATPAFVDRLGRLGHQARVLDVRTGHLGGPYDAVYANAVFLHLDREELAGVMTRAAQAVRPGGYLAFTVKEGDGERWSTHKLDAPRYFVYWREPNLRALLDASPWDVVDLRLDTAAREPWLLVLCRLG